MSRLRIVFLITGLNGGGAETMLLHLLRGMDRVPASAEGSRGCPRRPAARRGLLAGAIAKPGRGGVEC